MKKPSDSRVVLPENLCCDIAGLAPSKRRDWVTKKILDQPLKRANLTELQVVELSVVRELHDVFGPRDAPVVWREVRENFVKHVLLERLDIVVDVGYREATLATSDRAVSAAVRTGRAIRVVPVGPLVRRVRRAFRRLALSPVATAPKARRRARDTTA